MITEEIAYRPGVPRDKNFILNSMMTSFRDAPCNKLLGREEYNRYHDVFTRLLEVCKVTVAVSPEDHDQILGYAITASFGEAKVLVYVYVKHVFRRMGIGQGILSAAGISLKKPFFYLYLSRAGSIIRSRNREKYGQAVFNPFLIGELTKES